ncbi:hypothetical protein NHQ30_009019 [Ciborinia camelliae]|nr:hypothetical protein NHQ30_009019 [Ciborinia camelliae]
MPRCFYKVIRRQYFEQLQSLAEAHSRCSPDELQQRDHYELPSSHVKQASSHNDVPVKQLLPADQLIHNWMKTDIEDPGMNGGYINPPRVKRQFRDPHADWWDKQERRNYGEPVHEDNDILGMFSPEEYTHQKPGTAALQLGVFVLSVFGLCAVVGMMYPDKQSVPREFEGGLERELGGPTAVRARAAGDPL